METIEYKNHKIQIRQEESPLNPRKDFDNLWSFAFFHKRYNLANDEGLSIEEAQSIQNNPDYIAIKIYLHDHGDLTFSFAKTCRFDSGLAGIAYLSRKKLTAEEIDETKAREILNGEIETYNHYANGEIYYYYIKGELCNDSCGSFFGYDYEKNGLLDSARSAIDCAIKIEEDAKRFEASSFHT